MKKILSLCWFIALIVLLSFGFETVIWYVITPITVSVAQLPWLEFVVGLSAVICSMLFTAFSKVLGGMQ